MWVSRAAEGIAARLWKRHRGKAFPLSRRFSTRSKRRPGWVAATSTASSSTGTATGRTTWGGIRVNSFTEKNAMCVCQILRFNKLSSCNEAHWFRLHRILGLGCTAFLSNGCFEIRTSKILGWISTYSDQSLLATTHRFHTDPHYTHSVRSSGAVLLYLSLKALQG